ncbi:hypothetical protein B4U79_06737 [Dinothrombium tinctorium]|uniref:Intraflagellar transport protein 20-like protein n=1 Tax=Dinothrombium tinctorium TaxID=1965070 RepID=A0A3S3QQ28_9ACAR|nr:hypothetical protein B4U79_06737 [Dinothrombium tinctorium]
MAEKLAAAGLFFDQANRIRVLDPEASEETLKLNNDCSQFIEGISNFKNIVDNFITVVDKLANDVEKSKIKALGSRNLLKSVSKQREAEKQQLMALIAEKRQELQRLKIQHESLLKEESEQNDLFEHLSHQQ